MNPMHPAPVQGSGLLAEYPPPGNWYDEMLATSSTPLSHWQELLQAVDSLSREELQRRTLESQRLLREGGVTYNVYGDPLGRSRPWALDPFPVLLTHQEWSRLEAGLTQRAELLDRILVDLYGPQRLLRERILPPEIIFAHPGYMYPCSGMELPGKRRLILYAADLARGPRGEFVVTSDRAQAPSGTGYALENRVVMSRVMPSVYTGDTQVQRLAPFFRQVRETLLNLTPRAKDDPRVVLLTPGPDNETYFEHSYLANYLGFTLVQGGDLTVRDSRVWLKTLEGLQPVDVIMRRVDDTFCDPLELRNDSLLGTPGLVHAVRRGKVALANPLGSGLVENPALLPFLPDLCRYFLGEELKLPSIPTWWCGRPADCDYVLQNLDRLVVRTIMPNAIRWRLYGETLTPDEKDALQAQIRARPHRFVAYWPMDLSTAPTLVQGSLEPRRMSLRTFLVARQNDYLCMPGGLARVSPNANYRVVSNQTGGMSKDTWILGPEMQGPTQAFSLLARRQLLTRGGDDLPSRVAENLFWLGRYAERADSSARLLREVVFRLLDAGSFAWPSSRITHLLQMVTQHTSTYPGFLGLDAAERLSAPAFELLSILDDAQRTGGIRYDVRSALQAGRGVRERLSDDTWRLLNSLEEFIGEPVDLADALESLERLILALAGFAGLCRESMSRGPSWRFVEIGRRLERAQNTLALLRLSFPPIEGLGHDTLGVLLAVTDSWKTYRLRYGSSLQTDAVLDLCLLDEDHPRSVAHQVVRMQELVLGLPSRTQPPRRSPEERCLLEAHSALRLAEIQDLAPLNWETGLPPRLDDLLQALRSQLGMLSDALSQSHFSHTLEIPQQLVDLQ